MIHGRQWYRPQLITLARATPEEAVLGACKNGVDGTEPSNTQHGGKCNYEPAVGDCQCCRGLSST